MIEAQRYPPGGRSGRALVARVGLVLGAGGLTGHGFHAGVLHAIADVTGWDPRDAEVIVGTSAGAQVGAYLRAGLGAPDLAAHAADRTLSAEAEAILGRTTRAPTQGLPSPRRPLPFPPAAPRLVARGLFRPGSVGLGALISAGLPEGHVPLDRFAERIGRLFPDGWPERPLWLNAVRLDTGERVVLGRERTAPVGLAVAASCAIPAYFSPVLIDGVRHVDGGVHSPTNLDVLADVDLDLVIISAPMSVARRALRDPLPDLPTRSLLRWRLGREARPLRGDETRVVAFQPTRDDLAVMGQNSMDPRRRAPTARRAERSTRERLRHRDLAAELAGMLT